MATDGYALLAEYGGDAGLGDAVARRSPASCFRTRISARSRRHRRRSGSASNGVAGPGCVTGVAASVTRECVSAGHYTFLLVRPGSSTFLLPPPGFVLLTPLSRSSWLLLRGFSSPQSVRSRPDCGVQTARGDDEVLKTSKAFGLPRSLSWVVCEERGCTARERSAGCSMHWLNERV